jgi:hypothetical protein
MDYLAAMQAFVRSVDLGSFSKAAAEGGLKVSTVSRYVSALEADLRSASLSSFAGRNTLRTRSATPRGPRQPRSRKRRQRIIGRRWGAQLPEGLTRGREF